MSMTRPPHFFAACARLIAGLLSAGPFWVAWVAVLVGVNAIAPLFFWSTPQAKITAILFLAQGTLMALLTGASGYSRLLGLAHVGWFWLIPYLASAWSGAPLPTGLFAAWLMATIGLNAASLAIDVVDLARWLRGERGDLHAARRG